MIINKSIFYAFIKICFLSLCEKALRFILIIFLKYICTQLKKKASLFILSAQGSIKQMLSIYEFKIDSQHILTKIKCRKNDTYFVIFTLMWIEMAFQRVYLLSVSRKTISNLDLTVFWHLKKIIYYAFL